MVKFDQVRGLSTHSLAGCIEFCIRSISLPGRVASMSAHGFSVNVRKKKEVPQSKLVACPPGPPPPPKFGSDEIL